MKVINKYKVNCDNTERGRIRIAIEVLDEIKEVLPDDLRFETEQLNNASKILSRIMDYDVIN